MRVSVSGTLVFSCCRDGWRDVRRIKRRVKIRKRHENLNALGRRCRCCPLSRDRQGGRSGEPTDHPKYHGILCLDPDRPSSPLVEELWCQMVSFADSSNSFASIVRQNTIKTPAWHGFEIPALQRPTVSTSLIWCSISSTARFRTICVVNAMFTLHSSVDFGDGARSAIALRAANCTFSMSVITGSRSNLRFANLRSVEEDSSSDATLRVEKETKRFSRVVRKRVNADLSPANRRSRVVERRAGYFVRWLFVIFGSPFVPGL